MNTFSSIFQFIGSLFTDFSIRADDVIENIVGVSIGALLAFLGIKYQLKEESKKEKKKTMEILHALVNRAKVELRDNKHTIQNKLIPTLERTQKPNQLHYEWLIEITASFQNAAYEDLLRSNLSHNLPHKIEGSILTSYEMLDGLKGMVREALAGFRYQDLYGGTPDLRATSYKNIITYSHTVFSHLEYSVETVYKYAENNSEVIYSKKKPK